VLIILAGLVGGVAVISEWVSREEERKDGAEERPREHVHT
jgi:hypothetical protein